MEGVGDGMKDCKGDVGHMPELLQPPATSAALDSLKTEWQAGLQRLADDVRSLGQLTVAVAHIYDKVDNDQFAPGDP